MAVCEQKVQDSSSYSVMEIVCLGCSSVQTGTPKTQIGRTACEEMDLPAKLEQAGKEQAYRFIGLQQKMWPKLNVGLLA